MMKTKISMYGFLILSIGLLIVGVGSFIYTLFNILFILILIGIVVSTSGIVINICDDFYSCVKSVVNDHKLIRGPKNDWNS